MNKPEHITYFDELTTEPVDTMVHPVDDFSTIDQKFTTPFMESETILSEQIKKDLIEVLIKKEHGMEEMKQSNPDFYGMATSKGFYATTHYNLFQNLEEHPFARDSILAFEQIACQMIRYYIRKGWGIKEADDLELEGRCFGNVQESGARTYPHYHQDINGVLVHYLAVGDESTDLKERVSIDTEKSPRHPSHQVIFQDPRPAISYPYWEKVHTVTPKVGLTLIHPNYLWHETNPWLGEGIRVCIVVNFRIISHGYNELLKTFRG